MPRVTLREPGTAKLLGIRLAGKRLGLEIGLLRLIDSGTNPAVASFLHPGKSVVPKKIETAG